MNRKAKKVLIISLIFIIFLGGIFVYGNKNIIFQRGNPIPYLIKAALLREDKPYQKVFNDQEVYISRRKSHDDNLQDSFINFVENKYNVNFTEQAGSGYIFQSETHIVNMTTEVYLKYYNIWEISIGETPKLYDLIPMVMINGNLYLDTGKESDIDARCGVMDGKITSTVDGQKTPTQNNQSNFGKDFEYQYVDENNIDIVINGKWIRFKKEEDVLGLRFTTYNVTPKGLTLVFNQSEGNPSGSLDTGSRYWLELQINDGWIPLEFLPQEYEIAWTDEAYHIAMNDSTEFEVNWEWLYGELSNGNYRIGKEIMDFRGTGDYDTYIYYAYFEII